MTDGKITSWMMHKRNMALFYLMWTLFSIVNPVSGACPGHLGCPRCLDPGCTDCYTGYYGPNCSLSCSSGCRNNRCRLAPDGSAVCVEGCSPGLYGRQCNMGCLPPGETCSKCPSHCDNGFCQLDDRCVSGCKDSYYGTGCFTCGPGCQVGNNVTGECYTCEKNCSFSDCFANGDCSVNETSATLTSNTGNVHPAAIVVPVFLIIVVLGGFVLYRLKQTNGSPMRSTVSLFRKSPPCNYDMQVATVGSHRMPSYAEVEPVKTEVTAGRNVGKREIIRIEEDPRIDVEGNYLEFDDGFGMYDRLRFEPK